MRLRPDTSDDGRLLFDWRNEPATRANSFSQDPVSWDDHTAWLGRVLVDPNRVLYVAEDDRGAFGTVRLDVHPPPPVISITISPERRGEGLAHGLITAVTDRHGPPIVAFIMPANAPSLRAFLRAGFRQTGSEDDGWLRLVWDGRPTFA
jgi:RimJ/RimL family protein N-acetyltransferase